MKKLLILALSLVMTMLFAACGSTADNAGSVPAPKAADTKATEPVQAAAPANDAKSSNGKKILVAYFSRAGDNYQVGYIEKGNTHIMADMIAEAVGADTFDIRPAKPYPADYTECTEVAKKELEEDARPAIEGKVENWQSYDTVFLGYPIWWSELPMPVYTFMESYDWSGKTVIPFCTSAGDVLTGKESNIPRYAKGATLREGLGLEGKRVQESPDSAKPEVMAWLKKLGFSVS